MDDDIAKAVALFRSSPELDDEGVYRSVLAQTTHRGGRRTSVTDQNGKQTTYAYDDADRLLSVTDAAHHVTQYAYDEKATSLASPFPTTTRPEPASPIGYLRRSAATLASANRDLTSDFVAGGPAHAPGIEAYED